MRTNVTAKAAGDVAHARLHRVESGSTDLAIVSRSSAGIRSGTGMFAHPEPSQQEPPPGLWV